MECNRDEAARAKEIAEMKFEAKDYLGAKKFALKAQSLYPGLNGIQHMPTTLDIYISSENRVNGECDWYKVLDVNPHADEETIRKQYRKLLLILHPDKNKSIGANGAFKLISEAWNLLSDKSKRSLYDQKRNIKVVKPTVPSHASNGVGTSKKSATTPKTTAQKGKATKKNSRTPNGTATAPSDQQKYPITPTFWTVCHRCRLQHEYPCMYLHQNLLCPGCNLAYYAYEYPPPGPQNPKIFQWNHFLKKQPESTVGSSGSGPSHQTNPHRNPFAKTSGGLFADQATAAAQQASEKAKREQEDALKAKNRNREADLKRKSSASKKEVGSSSKTNTVKKRKIVEDPMDTKTQGGKSSSSEPDKGSKIKKPKISRDLPSFEAPRKLLIERAKVEIRNELNEWKNFNDEGKSVGNTKNNFNDGGKSVGNTKKSVPATEKVKLNDSSRGNHKDGGLKSISVPDSDFHDFDKDRTETCFGENQVWAAYDDDDGMPRYYALIHEVVSVKTFKVRISWLNSKTNTELGPLNWVGSGFTKTCGEFRIGKKQINESLNSFSHKVRWTKGGDGVVLVFPKKGDVWALYRNWSPKWNELTEDKVIHEYDMVEVLEDYDKELGVRVSPLIKVAGYKTVFRRHWDDMQTKIVPKEEIFRFSHQVPSVLLSGQEGENAPKGSRELDPAATPLELLQVISDGNGESMAGE